MQNFYLEILPQEQKQILNYLDPITQNNFILFGGTAIALQIGHRVSVDFDFFRSDPLNQNDKTMLSKLDFMKDFTTLQNEKDTFVVNVNGVKISFFGGIDFVNSCTPISFDTLKIANLKDLLGTKLAVITQRVEYKDYTDIAKILKTGISLKEGFERAKLFYGNQISINEISKTMIYFEGGDLDKLKIDDKKILIKSVRDFLNLKNKKVLSKNIDKDTIKNR